MAEVKQGDPFNWPALNRIDLMSLQTLEAHKDLIRVKTAQAGRKRDTSDNLQTQDIKGIHSYIHNAF